jgi:hypothetical protein
VNKQMISAALMACTLVGLSGCARGLAEGYGSMGFRDQKVVFVADQAEIKVRTTSEALKAIPYLRMGENTIKLTREVVRDSMTKWGSDCGAQFFPKEGSYSLRMGLMHAADGWNVADPNVVRNYSRANNTDYIVMVNSVEIRRGEVSNAAGRRMLGADVNLDITVIDARQGLRSVRETTTGHFESADSLHALVPQALGLAVDNFFVGVPEARRWGCKGLADRFK